MEASARNKNKWILAYALVIGFLVFQIVFYYFFMLHYK